MSQFRTTADIQNEVLQKAGEPTNGNSPFESISMTYLNKVHHALIGGGSIFNIDVDEPWVWARSRQPIVLELEPAYTTGAVTFTVNDVNILFSNPPSVSIEGWYIQVLGKPTVYRITQHTAGNVQAQIDSSFLDSSATYSYRAFKLDYEIIPAYMYVDSLNDKIDFKETASTVLAATLTHGAYTPAGLVAHAVARLNSTGTASWTGSYDSVMHTFQVTASVTASVFGATGTNRRRSAMTLLGMDQLDQTASSFTSSYTPNTISRLIEPFKIFTAACDEPFIRSTDPIKMQEDYPVALTQQKVPDRFCRVTEDNSGSITVRFNAYPAYKTKAMIDWIPAPRDLQDNAASYPLIPRSDIDVLIHGAAAYIAFDKEDSKFDIFMKLVGSGLQAMQKKNRALLMRTGENFAQIVPRNDLQRPYKLYRYGYTAGGSSAANITTESVQSMIPVTISYTSFQAASTTSTATARTLPANRTLFSLIVKHSTPFSGTPISNVVVDVGISGDATKFINAFDVDQATAAAAQDSAMAIYYPAADTPIQVRMTAVGGNLSNLTAGTVVLYFQELINP